MLTSVVFGEVVCQIADPRLPCDIELQLGFSVLEPPVLFVKCSALLLFDGTSYESLGCLIICSDDSGWLCVA